MWRIGKLPLTYVCVCIYRIVQLLSHVRLFGIPRAAALRVSLSFTVSQSFLRCSNMCVFYVYIADSHCCTSAAAAKSLQSCPTLRDPIDGSPPGSAIPGILQARTLEWVAISFSNAWKWKVKVKSLSHVWLLATPWTASYQAPPSMGFSRQENWSGMPLPAPCCTPETNKTR